jgi:S-adenosylmethionine decarboxylase
MNAIAYGNYATVHITPEPECSYASFETNTPLRSYDSLINNVLRVFKPKRFVLTMMADEAAVAEMSLGTGGQPTPFTKAKTVVPGLGCYVRKNTASTTFEKDYHSFCGNWVLQDPEVTKADPAVTVTAAAGGGIRSASGRARERGLSFS